MLGEQFSWYLGEDANICVPYLEAVLRFWSVFEREGPCFASLNEGEFWEVRSGIHVALGVLDAPELPVVGVTKEAMLACINAALRRFE